MIWIYVFALAVGLMLIVPTLLQAFDRRRADGEAVGSDAGLFEFTAFAATMFGASGLIVERFEPSRATSLIVALTLGLAAGAIHPEVLAQLSRSRTRR